MEKEQAKELLPFIKAYAEGKQLQFKNSKGNWVDFCYNVIFDNLNPGEVRLKSSVTHRPFNSPSECWEEMKKHQPFGWVKSKDCDLRQYVTSVDSEGVIITDYEEGVLFLAYCVVFNDFTFEDGEPFGIKEVNDAKKPTSEKVVEI